MTAPLPLTVTVIQVRAKVLKIVAFLDCGEASERGRILNSFLQWAGIISSRLEQPDRLLSSNTVRSYHRIISSCLGKAVKWG